MRTIRGNLVLMALTVAVMLGGCGRTEEARNTTATGQGRVTWELFDCSGFRRFAADYVPDLLTVAKHVAAQDPPGKLAFACVDGQPLTNARVTTVDFGTRPQGADLDPGIVADLNRAKAEGLKTDFEARIKAGRHDDGSGLLQGLKFAADQPGLARVYFWTDGEVRDREGGFNLPTATAPEIEAQVKHWAPRLAGLRGVQVVLVGGGRGAQNQETALKAEQLFRALLKAVGGELVWTPTLGQADLN